MQRIPTIVFLILSDVCLLAHAGAGLPDKVTEGMLVAYDGKNTFVGYCPLKHTDVEADISGGVARVTVTQQFENPYPDPIEAVYVFPLSERGAVDRMKMKVGTRSIKGIIKERGEARRIYEKAKSEGKRAALLDEERPNIFTQSVANIMPGDHIEVVISYVERLKYEEGEYEFFFPMVVGPRYIPGAPQPGGTDQVPDADKVVPPYAYPEGRSGHDVSVKVTIEPGIPIRSIKSILHEVDIRKQRPETRAVVTLANKTEIPNRDFILRYGVATEFITDAVLVHHKKRGGFFSVTLYPPARVTPDQIAAKEMIFVIDSSGSMSGFPIEKAKKTMRLCIENMNPNDTFNLISFSGGQGYCFPQSVANSPENRETALKYLEQLAGGGGTEMMGAVKAALGGPRDPGKVRVVCFMTDGFVGNDLEVLDEIKKTAGSARVFSFGIGESVNRFLIEGMAQMGRGASEVVTLESGSDEAADRFYKRIHCPVLTDIQVEIQGFKPEQMQPPLDAVPDLFSESPLVLTGRYTKPGKGTMIVRGRAGSGSFEKRIPITLPAYESDHDVLAPLWARAKIDALMAQNYSGMQSGHPTPDVKDEITKLGLDFHLVTPFTSFVAVERTPVNPFQRNRRVEVPVSMPQGVDYEMALGTPGGMAPPPAPSMAPAPCRKVPIFNHILFAYNSADLGAEAKAELDKLIAALKAHTKDTVLLLGHTCNTGAAEYNMALGLRRAEAVKAYLVKQGINADRIQVKSFGATQPAVPNDSPANQKLNRRVVTVITYVD